MGEIGFTLITTDAKSPISSRPFVYINLTSWGRTLSDGAPVLSADLMSDAEIDYYVDQLKTDLEAVRIKAKRALGKALVDEAERRSKP